MADIIDLEMYKKKKEDINDLNSSTWVNLSDEEEPISIDEFVNLTLHDIIDASQFEYNCDPKSNPKCINDLLFIGEALKSFLYRTQGQHYPLSDMIDSLGFPNNHEKILQTFMNGYVANN